MVVISNIILAMPELLRSAKLAIEKGQSQGRDVSYLKFLTDSIIPALVEALHKVFVIQVHPFLAVLVWNLYDLVFTEQIILPFDLKLSW